MRFVIQKDRALKMLDILKMFPDVILGTVNDNVISIQRDKFGYLYRYAEFRPSFFEKLNCSNNKCDYFKVKRTKLLKIVRTLKDDLLYFEYPNSKGELGITTSTNKVHLITKKLEDIEKKKDLFFSMVNGTPILQPDTERIRLDSCVVVRKSDIIRRFKIVDVTQDVRFTLVCLKLSNNEFTMRLVGQWDYDLDIEFKPKCIIKSFIEPAESWYWLEYFKKVIEPMGNNFKMQFTTDSPLWISNNKGDHRFGAMLFPYIWEE